MTGQAVNTPDYVLLIDLGNTRLKLGLWHEDAGETRYLNAHPHQTQESLLDWLDQELLRLGVTPHKAIGVSVASQALMLALEGFLASRNQPIPVEWVWPAVHAHGVHNAYPDPAQLGADRWAGMLGVMKRFAHEDRSIVLANFGTATTIDTLSRDRRFLGGLILPGVSMMQMALSKGTARLPMATGEVADYPANTHAAITTGIVAAQLGAIRRQIDLSQERDQRPPLMCVSGGAWDLLRKEWHRTLPGTLVEEVPNVVLDGLSLFAGPQLRANSDGPVV